MSDGDRTTFAAIEALIGASMAVAGLVAQRHAGFVAVIGLVLLVLGVLGLIQAVAVGLRLLTPKDPTRGKQRRD